MAASCGRLVRVRVIRCVQSKAYNGVRKKKKVLRLGGGLFSYVKYSACFSYKKLRQHGIGYKKLAVKINRSAASCNHMEEEVITGSYSSEAYIHRDSAGLLVAVYSQGWWSAPLRSRLV